MIGVGCCAFDLVIEVDRYPGADDKIIVDQIRTQGGGLTATALVAVARLGGRCAYLGALGDDYFSQFCLDEFAREGVEAQTVRRVPGASVVTALIVACPAQGTRMILASRAKAPPSLAADVPEEVVRASRVVHVDNFGAEGAVHAARLARACGVPVTMDLEPGGGGPVEELMELGDYVIVPVAFARGRYGTETAEEGARALFEEVQANGGVAGVVTAGAEGSHAVYEGGQMSQPAYRASVVDTTGCGDVFHGAFALGLARGWPLRRILPYAAAVAALKCRAHGGRAGIPTEDEVQEFLGEAEPLT